MAGSSSRIASEVLVFENMSEVRSTIIFMFDLALHATSQFIQVDHELEALRMLCVSLGNTHIA